MQNHERKARGLSRVNSIGKEKIMPYINVILFPGQTKEKKKTIAEKITKVINEELPKVPDQNIWITFQEVEADEWSIGGKMCK